MAKKREIKVGDKVCFKHIRDEVFVYGGHEKGTLFLSPVEGRYGYIPSQRGGMVWVFGFCKHTGVRAHIC